MMKEIKQVLRQVRVGEFLLLNGKFLFMRVAGQRNEECLPWQHVLTPKIRKDEDYMGFCRDYQLETLWEDAKRPSWAISGLRDIVIKGIKRDGLPAPISRDIEKLKTK
jgi:hypothetical protein